MSQPAHTLGAPQPAAYVFGPWITPTDRPNFAYRSAPREDDRAEVWLHVPDDGGEPYWAGCYGTLANSVILHGVEDLGRARWTLDLLIVSAGHHLFERVQATAQRWKEVGRVAREIDAQHRGAGLMADDDLVDLIARALKDFPGLVRERDRLRAVLDAEAGRKGLPGWTWNEFGRDWRLCLDGGPWLAIVKPVAARGVSIVVESEHTAESRRHVSSCPGKSALEDMEYAEDRLRALGRLPPKG